MSVSLPDATASAPQLSEAQRTQPLMYTTDAWYNLVYSIPGYNPDALIAFKGWDEIDKMLTMSAYSSPLCIKKVATLHQPMEILSAVQDKKDADKYNRAQEARDLVQYVMDNIENPETGRIQKSREILWDLCDAFHRGLSVVELMWRTLDDGPYKGKWGLKPAIPRHPKQLGFRLHPKTLEVQEITSRSLGQGDISRVPVEKCLIYTYNSSNHLIPPFGMGHARTSYKHYLCLNLGYRDYGIHVEREAGGLLWGETLDNTDMSRRKLHALLTMARQSSVLVTSKGEANITSMPASVTGTNIFMHFLEEHCNQITQDILGQSLTTRQNDSRGSFSLGEIQEKVQETLFAWGRGGIQSVVEKLFRLIVLYNLGRDYLDVVPTCFLGVFDIRQRMAVSQLLASFAKFGDLHREEPFLRDLLQFPPRDPALSDYQKPGENNAPDGTDDDTTVPPTL